MLAVCSKDQRLYIQLEPDVFEPDGFEPDGFEPDGFGSDGFEPDADGGFPLQLPAEIASVHLVPVVSGLVS